MKPSGKIRFALATLVTVLGLALTHAAAQAPAEVPVFKILREDSSIKFHVKASVAIDGTFDKWDAAVTTDFSFSPAA
jgi:hypothetical protein